MREYGIRRARDLTADEIRFASSRHGGERDAMASELGVSRKALVQRMKALGL